MRWFSKRVLDLYLLPQHRPVQFPLHIQQLLVELRVWKVRRLQNRRRQGLIRKLAFPVPKLVSDQKLSNSQCPGCELCGLWGLHFVSTLVCRYS